MMWESMNENNCDGCHCQPRSKKSFKCPDNEDALLDKENISNNLSPMKNEDMSLYTSGSPLVSACNGTSPNHCLSRRPLIDCDPNSQDSGYLTNYYNETCSRFSSYASPTRDSALSFGSNSMGSLEEDFMEDFLMEPLDTLDENYPQNFSSLINAPLTQNIKTDNVVSYDSPPLRPIFRRALSLQIENTTPNSSRARCLFSDNKSKFKRPDPPNEAESPSVKRSKKVDDDNALVPSVPVLQRSMSVSEESIKYALHRSSLEPDLIGDFTKSFTLPLVQGRHQDLKAIDSTTLVELLQGKFESVVGSFKVIDCRYPYEFEGGHIEGAVNIYTREQCLELLDENNIPQHKEKCHILVFHCEFSSERGPNLYRYLRKQDRSRNAATYPALHYPEIYLLEGGYKNFYEQFKNMCVPVSYKPMHHPEHQNDLRKFRQKSKTWNMDRSQRTSGKVQLRRFL